MDLVEARGWTEDRHPWELARAVFFNREILKAVGNRPVRVLDIGCGDGWFARQLIPRLPPSSTVTGWDIELTDERMAIFAAGLPSGMELTGTEPSGEFDVILCMDVIEHVADDLALLTDLCRRFLRPGGWFLCSVPAWPVLFSRHDIALRHFRRYTPAMGVQVLTSAGLIVRRKGGLFHGLAAIRGIQVVREGRARPLAEPRSAPVGDVAIGVSRWNAPRPVTRLITALIAAEGLVSRASSSFRLELPGLSWWALCEKP